MEIEVLFFNGCPAHEPTVELLRDTIERLGIEASVTEVNVRTDEEAERQRFPGSPTVRVDGEDIEPGTDTEGSCGRRCRVYETPEGLRGVPPARMLEAALTGERYEPPPPATQSAPNDCCASDTTTTVELLVADWCPQCPAAKVFWTELRDEEEFELHVIDIESNAGAELARVHGIRAVPTAVIDGVVEFRGTPFPDRKAVTRKLR